MYCIVDIETTGYGSRGNKITEIAIYKFDGQQVVDEFYSLVNPECSIPYNISLLTGIYNETVMGAPKFYEIAKEVFLFTEGCIFVAHNVSFDYNTIRNEFSEIGGTFKRKKLCTVRLSRKIIPGLPSYSLGKLCHSLGIEITDRHRARGDAAATVELFELLLRKDDEGWIEKSLKPQMKQSFLPPLITEEEFLKLPEETGVYYFRNEKGEVIYVGKAKDIRQRVKSHFQDKTRKEVVMQQLVAKVDFVLTGSELVALLLESDEIKKLKPTYNSAQKRTNEGVVVFNYEDNNGYVRFSYTRKKRGIEGFSQFYNIGDARNFLTRLCKEFELCPKLCGLQKSNTSCFDYQIKKCKGACCSEEVVQTYNVRAMEAMESIQLNEDMVILDQGREKEERSVVWIQEGRYKGFGYVASREERYERVVQSIESYSDNSDVQRIIRGYINQRIGELEILRPA